MPRAGKGSADVSTRERAVELLQAQRELGGRVRTLRKWCRASLRSFSRVTGISLRSLRSYEEGTALPDPGDFLTLTEVLNVRGAFLAWGLDPPSEEDLTTLRLAWTMVQASPGHVRATLELVEGILSQMPDTPKLHIN